MKTYYTIAEFVQQSKDSKHLGLTFADYNKVKREATNIQIGKGQKEHSRKGTGIKSDMSTPTANLETWEKAFKILES